MAAEKVHKRLGALDLLRGFFLFVIIVDHVELFPSLFDMFTGKGRLWVSAAEGFFFISGLLVGYIYRRKLANGFGWIWAKAWRRAAVLYAWAVGLTLAFTVWGASLGGEFIKYGLPAGALNWPDIVWQTLTLHYTYGWADFLAHYVVFMLAAPLVIYLLSKNKWWIVVIASLGLWLMRGESFKLAWQLLFVGGMITGYYWIQLQAKLAEWSPARQKLARNVVYSAAGVSFTLSYVSVYVLGGLNDHITQLPSWAVHITQVWDNWNTFVWRFFEKWTLEPGRIILFSLWFTALYVLVSRHLQRIPELLRRWLSLLGTNSLFVYGAHSVVVFVVHILASQSLGLWTNCLVTAITLAVVTGFTWMKVVVDRDPAPLRVRAKRRLARLISAANTPTP